MADHEHTRNVAAPGAEAPAEAEQQAPAQAQEQAPLPASTIAYDAWNGSEAFAVPSPTETIDWDAASMDSHASTHYNFVAFGAQSEPSSPAQSHSSGDASDAGSEPVTEASSAASTIAYDEFSETQVTETDLSSVSSNSSLGLEEYVYLANVLNYAHAYNTAALQQQQPP